MCHRNRSISMLESLLPGHRHDHMSWTKIAVTGVLVYMGTKVLMDMMDDHD